MFPNNCFDFGLAWDFGFLGAREGEGGPVEPFLVASLYVSYTLHEKLYENLVIC